MASQIARDVIDALNSVVETRLKEANRHLKESEKERERLLDEIEKRDATILDLQHQIADMQGATSTPSRRPVRRYPW